MDPYLVLVQMADKMKLAIYDNDTNDLSIYWVNAKGENVTMNFEIQSFYQSIVYPSQNQMYCILTVSQATHLTCQKTLTKAYDISILAEIMCIIHILLLEENGNHLMIPSFLMCCVEADYFLVISCMKFLSHMC